VRLVECGHRRCLNRKTHEGVRKSYFGGWPSEKLSLAAFRHWCHVFADTMRKAMALLSFRPGASRRVWAGICLALFLALQLFTSCETLHKLIHPDADSPDHECAITMLLHGQVNASETVSSLIAFVAALFFVLPPLVSATFPSFDYRFSFSRAPPLA
jgi:hypothetical protein